MSAAVSPEVLRSPSSAPPSEVRARLEAPPGQLGLVGRDAEQAALGELIASGARLITLAGGPGIGKSVLAERIARAESEAWVFDWTDVQGLEEAYALIARSLGLIATSSSFEAAMAIALEARRPRIVVIDNVEHARKPAALLATMLCELDATVTVLVTSRRALELGWERVFELGPLSCESHDDGTLSDAALMLARKALGPDEIATEAERDALERLARAAEGVPIALETIAARLASLPLAVALRDLASPEAVLASASGSSLSRHVSVESALSWSWDHLSAEEKADLFAASTFAGPFDVETASVVLLRPESVVSRLLGLRANHLVEITSDEADIVCRVPSLIRSFVRARGDVEGSLEIRNRHARHFLEAAARTPIDWVLGLNSTHAPARFEEVLFAVDSALSTLESSNAPDSFDVDLLLSALCGLGAMAVDGSSAKLVALRLERAAQFASSASRAAESRLWIVSGSLSRLHGDVSSAIAAFELAAAEAPSPELRAIALLAESAALAMAGRLEEARALLPLAETEHSPRLRAEALKIAAGISGMTGDLTEAEHLARLALRTQISADLEPQPSFEILLSVLIAENGRFADARLELEGTRARMLRAGHSRFVGLCETNLAAMAFECDELPQAIAGYHRAHEAHAKMGDGVEAGIALGYGGVAHLVAKDYSQAAIDLERAVRLFTRAGAADRAQTFRGFLAVALAHQRSSLVRERAFALASELGSTGAANLLAHATRALLAPREDKTLVVRTAEVALEDARLKTSARFEERLARRVLEGALIAAIDDARPLLRVALDGTGFEVSGEWVDLTHRPTLVRILSAISRTRNGALITSADLIDAGWPGERILRRAALSRLRVALCTLRKMGLRGHLISCKDGHVLRGRVEEAESQRSICVPSSTT